jgi:hypothetical protein
MVSVTARSERRSGGRELPVLITDAEWEELLALAETASCAMQDFSDYWNKIREREDEVKNPHNIQDEQE